MHQVEMNASAIVAFDSARRVVNEIWNQTFVYINYIKFTGRIVTQMKDGRNSEIIITIRLTARGNNGLSGEFTISLPLIKHNTDQYNGCWTLQEGSCVTVRSLNYAMCNFRMTVEDGTFKLPTLEDAEAMEILILFLREDQPDTADARWKEIIRLRKALQSTS